jgi:hypothetical protein
MNAARLELDYVAPVRRARWPGVLALALSLALASAMLERYSYARAETARLEAESALAEMETPAASAVSAGRVEEEARRAEAVVRQLALPWASLIEMLEQAALPDVALLLLQPDPERHSLRLVAEARNREVMFEFVRRLAAAPGLAEVHMLDHQLQRDDPRRPLHFSVQASIREPR